MKRENLAEARIDSSSCLRHRDYEETKGKEA